MDKQLEKYPSLNDIKLLDDLLDTTNTNDFESGLIFGETLKPEPNDRSYTFETHPFYKDIQVSTDIPDCTEFGSEKI